MSLTNFPNGVTSFGVPVMGGGGVIPATTGTYFFVYSGDGADGNSGLSPDDPLATIDAAINKCTADKGDVIIVMPGHAETITTAAGIVVDVNGISIIGLGNGRNRPVITFGATAARIPVSADNVVIRNLVFLSGIADVVSGVTVTGDDVALIECEWAVSGAALEFLQMLDIDTAVRCQVVGCRFLASTTAGTNTGIRLDTATACRIAHSELRGDFTTGAISGTAGSAAASTDVTIEHNLIENRDTTTGVCIDLHNSGTGIVANNRMFHLNESGAAAGFDPGNALNNENYVVNAVDETGLAVPTTAST